MLIARLYALVAAGALSIYAIRTFTTHAYGRYAIAFALITIFGLVSEMGISTLALREMAMHPAREARTLGVALWAELLTSIVTSVAMFPIALILGYSAGVLALLGIGAGIILFQGLSAAIDVAFQARRRLIYAAVSSVIQTTVTVAVGFALVAKGVGPAALLTAVLVGYAAAVPAALLLLLRRLRIRPILRDSWRQVLGFVRIASPIAITGGMTIIYDRIDVLMLSKLDGTRAVAVYSVPLTILQYSMILPAIVATAFFPLLAEVLRSAPAAARDAFGLLFRAFVLTSVSIAIVLTVGGETLLVTLFGARYRASAGPLAILAWSVVLGFLNYLLWYSLLAAYRERAKLKIMLVGLGLNVALNAALIPTLGPSGAAISLIATDLLIVTWQGVLVRRHLFALSLAQLTVKPLLAAGAATPVVIVLLPAGHLLAGIAGALTYSVALLAMQYIAIEEWDLLLAPARTMFTRVRTAARG